MGTEQWRLALGAMTLVALIGWGCAPQAPVVTNQLQPWEEEYARAMMRPEALLPTPAPTPPGLVHTHPASPEQGEQDSSQAAAELIGMPFRGLGWLLRAVF